MKKPEITQLIEAGAHFGHLTRRWNPKMKPYIFMEKNGIHIIDLKKHIILKCFYMGTLGNEKLTLSQEEWEWLYKNEPDEERDGVTYKKNIKDVIRKMLRRGREENMPYFKELHLALGRRSSKCREENDIIATTEGSISFRELCDRLNNNEKIGICTYDPITLKRSVTYDIKAQDNGIVDCYEVETKRGIIEASSWNHPYLVWRKEWDKPKFVEMHELLVGDKIAVAKCTELFGKGGIGIEKATLLGQEIIKEIHNSFDIAEDKLLKEAEDMLESLNITTETKLEEKAERLEKIGFINSKHVVKNKEIKQKIQKNQESLVKTKQFADLIRYYKREYPFQKFLTEKELNSICDKYSLIYAPINNYI